MNAWLYPISVTSNRFFVMSDRKKIRVSLENFCMLVVNGRIQEDDWWYLKANFKNILPGDEIFIYTGNKDVGIVGYAIVKTVETRKNQRGVSLQFDLDKCKALLATPIGAKMVRSWIHFPRGPVWNLKPFRAELETLLPWNRLRK